MRKHVLNFFCKRLMLLLFFALAGIHSYSQDSPVGRANNDSKNDCTQAGLPSEVVYLPADTAQCYICHYRKRFCKRNNLKHTKSIFIDTSFFYFFDKFFKDAPCKKYDGMRIFFASYNKLLDAAYTHQADSNQISLIFAPTIDSVAQLDDFDTYADITGYDKTKVNHGEFCPYACDTTTATCVKAKGSCSITMPKGPSVTFATPLAPKGVNPFLFLRRIKSDEYIANYRRKYCIFWNKKHSKSLWMPLIDFETMNEFFMEEKGKPNKTYAGVRVYFAAYNKKKKYGSYNVRRKQITLLFTAVKNNPTKEPDFDGLNKFTETKFADILRRKKFDEGSQNHGELCPSKCDDDGH